MNEQVWWLTEDELERWREIQAGISAAENTTTVDEFQHARALYFDSYIFLAEVYERLGLEKTRGLSINPATGSIVYLPYDVEMVEA